MLENLEEHILWLCNHGVVRWFERDQEGGDVGGRNGERYVGGEGGEEWGVGRVCGHCCEMWDENRGDYKELGSVWETICCSAITVAAYFTGVRRR